MKRNDPYNETKQFFCHVENCLMKFSSEDRLEAHVKRHEISLIVSNKNGNYADQTPTPTRFIRNCEEVGLFQDLQNVNPFEETFRKAVEASKSGLSAPCLTSQNDRPLLDDTLHTPNIFPTLHTSPIPSSTQTLAPEPLKPTESDLPKASEIKLQKPAQKIRNQPSENLPKEQNFVIVDRNLTFKLPIPRLPPVVKVYSAKAFSVMSQNVSKKTPDVPVAKPKKKPCKGGREDLKEFNRLAAIRSRQKKKHYVSFLQGLNDELIAKNREMQNTIDKLKEENSHLKEQLRLCGGTETQLMTVQVKEPAQFSLEQQKRRCFYASLPVADDLPEKSCPTKEGFLSKPIKKRGVPSKLSLNCSVTER